MDTVKRKEQNEPGPPARRGRNVQIPESYQHSRGRHVGGVLAVVVFCALQVFQRWRELGRSFATQSPLEFLSIALLVVTCLGLLTIFMGSRERFIVVVAMVVLLSDLAATFLNPIASLVNHGILVLWFLALLMGLSMFVWPPQSPRIEVGAAKKKYGTLILFAVGFGAVILGALIYFRAFR
jgi:hypothetical protein